MVGEHRRMLRVVVAVKLWNVISLDVVPDSVADAAAN
jgi:hypothetical protein